MTALKISKDRSEPGHAVLVVADPNVSKTALDHQCQVLAAADLEVQKVQIESCGHFDELKSIADTCRQEAAAWLADDAMRSITLLVWCSLSSPLRVLPASLSDFDAAMVRVFGGPGHTLDGCPDHQENGEYKGPRRLDYINKDNEFVEVELDIDDSPEEVAYRRLRQFLKRHVAALSLSRTTSFDPTPITWLDPPLVNGHLYGEVDDDPRDL